MISPTCSSSSATFSILKKMVESGPLALSGLAGATPAWPAARSEEQLQVTSAQSNPHDFVPAMAEIAREAGALLMGYFRQHVKIEYKGEADLVTVADRAP